MKRTTIITLALMLSAGSQAQRLSIDSILSHVERNNTALQALTKNNEAEKLSLKSANNLRETTINYSPFYADGVSGVASSEFIVSQEFDFPTLYAARSKAAKLESKNLDMEYFALRNDILLEAQLLCIEMLYLYDVGEVLDSRRQMAQNMQKHYETMCNEGSATIIELNKVKLEHMKAKAEHEQSHADYEVALQSLIALNGNKAIEVDPFNQHFSPLPDDNTILAEYMANDAQLKAASAQTDVSAQQIKVSKQNGMPKLSVGYRRNTELSSARNGFLIGAAIPIFSNRNKVREAKMRHESMQMQLKDNRIQTETALRTVLAEIRHTEEALKNYDKQLLKTAKTNIITALREQQINVIDYYREYNDIYEQELTLLQLVKNYRSLVARVMRYRL